MNREKLKIILIVLVISANYRLGVFGFWFHPSLDPESVGLVDSGNQGLLDQQMAMKWTQSKQNL